MSRGAVIKSLISLIAVLVMGVQAEPGGESRPRGSGLLARQNAPGQAGSASAMTIRWDKVYDKSGNLITGGQSDNVSLESLYFKDHQSLAILYGCPKAQVPNPVPANCRPPFAWQSLVSVVGMDPLGAYIYEVAGSNLRRHSASDGTYTDYAIAHGYSACGTDGDYIYAPVSDTVYKYTPGGALVSSTALDITPQWYEFSVANDTVWCGANNHIMSGYACSKFSGGSITADAHWDVGSGTMTPGLVAWDGEYYYVTWDGGLDSNTFKRFNPDRTLSAYGWIHGSPFGVMCKTAARPLMLVTTDDQSYRLDLAETLKVASGGVLDSIGTCNIGTSVAFPVTDWYDEGCRVILEFSGGPYPSDPVRVGDSLAKFVDMGGRVVTAAWADAGAANLAGRYVSQYMPFTSQPNSGTGGTMTTVHDPSHPIMAGVDSISASNWVTGNTHSTLRSPNCVCLAEWDSLNRSVVAYFESTGVRTVSIGFVPFRNYSGVTGQWAKLLANAILWVRPGSGGIAQPESSFLPTNFDLIRPLPNPVASGTHIRYVLPRSEPVDLRIYNVAGAPVRRLVSGGQSAGHFSAYWNARDDAGRRVAPGVYYVRLRSSDYSAAQKLIVVP
jgi:hypothetical protein